MAAPRRGEAPGPSIHDAMCDVGGAILPAKGFRHGPASPGYRGWGCRFPFSNKLALNAHKPIRCFVAIAYDIYTILALSSPAEKFERRHPSKCIATILRCGARMHARRWVSGFL